MEVGTMILYNQEKNIAEKCNIIIQEYYKDKNDKQKNQKRYELFHMLTFLSVKGIEYCKIIPNEPGDFLLMDVMGKTHLYEVVTVFGNKHENIWMKSLLEEILGCKSHHKEDVNFNGRFNGNQLFENLIKSIDDKNGRDYNKDGDYTTTNLLIVTSEYDRCSICGSWFLRFCSGDIELLQQAKKFNKIYTIDYHASAIDDGPVVGDLEVDNELVIECLGRSFYKDNRMKFL